MYVVPDPNVLVLCKEDKYLRRTGTNVMFRAGFPTEILKNFPTVSKVNQRKTTGLMRDSTLHLLLSRKME